MIQFAVNHLDEGGKTETSTSGDPVQVADGNQLQVLGQFEAIGELDGKAGGIDLKVVVTNVPQLNLLEKQLVRCRRPANSVARSCQICSSQSWDALRILNWR